MRAACAIVLCHLEGLACMEVQRVTERGQLTYPYIPGQLALRELPLMLAAWERLRRECRAAKGAVLLVDGAGVAHPHSCGLACAFGEAAGVRTIGVAKGYLCGRYAVPPEPVLEPELPRGRTATEAPLWERGSGEVIGSVLRPGRSARRLLFVSPGWPLTMPVSTAAAAVRAALLAHSAPEPLRRAHLAAREALGSL